MAYPTGVNFLATTMIGAQPITTTSTTQNHPLGTRIKALDATLGEAEFIYLKGVASTAQGDAVVYDLKDSSTTRVLDDTGVGPMAVAMSANVASQYGWYAIVGSVPVNAGTIAAKDTAVYLSGTAGQLDDGVVAGDLVVGALWGSVDTAGFAYVNLDHPFISQTTS
jgi:hypothetical protein